MTDRLTVFNTLLRYINFRSSLIMLVTMKTKTSSWLMLVFDPFGI